MCAGATALAAKPFPSTSSRYAPPSHRSCVAKPNRTALPSPLQYKFIVDGEWKYDPNQPAMFDEMRNVNNVIEVHEYVPENLEGVSGFDPPPSPPARWGPGGALGCGVHPSLEQGRNAMRGREVGVLCPDKRGCDGQTVSAGERECVSGSDLSPSAPDKVVQLQSGKVRRAKAAWGPGAHGLARRECVGCGLVAEEAGH